jgi:hypothetical protein
MLNWYLRITTRKGRVEQESELARRLRVLRFQFHNTKK